MRIVADITQPLVRVVGHINNLPQGPHARAVVHVFLKGNQQCWKLGNAERIRFRKHGIISVEWFHTYAPYIRIRLPRRKWNPDGPGTYLLPLPIGACELLVSQDSACYRVMDSDEYDSIVETIQKQKSSHPYGTKAPRCVHA